MRILVTDGMDKTAMAQLREMGHEVVEQFYEPDQLGKALRDFDVVVVRSKTKVRANHIDEAKGSNLKLIIRGGVGVDNIDVKYAEANGIAVKNTPKASSQSVAELAMGHMFSCARYISHAGYTMRNDQWEKKAYGKGIELQGKTLGIVGFGRIGQHLGVMAKAIGMDVIAFDIFHIPGIEEQLGIPYVEMDELLAKSDFISVHAPAVDGGALISAENIAKMKDGVMIINTGRGLLIHTNALIEGLKTKKVSAAGLDVYEEEGDYFYEDKSDKIIDDDVLARLLSFNNVIVTSHQAFFTKEALHNIADTTLRNIKDFEEGRPLVNEVTK